MQAYQLARAILAAVSTLIAVAVCLAGEVINDAGYKFAYPDGWVSPHKPDQPVSEIGTGTDIYPWQGMVSEGNATIGVYLLPEDPEAYWKGTRSAVSSLANAAELRGQDGTLTRVDYEDTLGDGAAYRHRDIFKKLPSGWFVVSLSFHVEDPRAPSYVEAVGSVAESLTVVNQ